MNRVIQISLTIKKNRIILIFSIIILIIMVGLIFRSKVNYENDAEFLYSVGRQLGYKEDTNSRFYRFFTAGDATADDIILNFSTENSPSDVKDKIEELDFDQTPYPEFWFAYSTDDDFFRFEGPNNETLTIEYVNCEEKWEGTKCISSGGIIYIKFERWKGYFDGLIIDLLNSFHLLSKGKY